MAPSGRVFREGEPLEVKDLQGGKEAGWRILERLIREWRVLEKDSFDDGPQAA